MSPDKKKKDEEKEVKRKLRQPLTPSPTSDLDQDMAVIIRGVALHCASTVLSSNTTATTKQTVAMASRFEAYLLTGEYVDGVD